MGTMMRMNTVRHGSARVVDRPAASLGPSMPPAASLVGLLLLGSGCPGDDATADPTTTQASGFANDSSGGPGDTTATDATATTTGGPGPADSSESGEPWGGTAFVGDIRAVLTVTFTPAHALSGADQVGMAGGYRIAEIGWDGQEDLYSPVAYQLALPPPPEQPDTLLPAESIPVYDWGDDEDWLVAGYGMKLRASDGDGVLAACLLVTGDYPLYRTSDAMGVDEQCAPDPADWSAAADYDVVLYGGELFADNVLPRRITTPPALTVTAPDLEAFGVGVPADEDLAITWAPGDDPEARIIIRVIDDNGNVITVHASDDGDYTIPAAELGELVAGPIDLSIARERTDRVQFTDGGLTVLARTERWGFFDLF